VEVHCVVWQEVAPVQVCWQPLPWQDRELVFVFDEVRLQPPPAQSRVICAAPVAVAWQLPPGQLKEQLPPVHVNWQLLPLSPPHVLLQSLHEHCLPAMQSSSAAHPADEAIGTTTVTAKKRTDPVVTNTCLSIVHIAIPRHMPTPARFEFMQIPVDSSKFPTPSARHRRRMPSSRTPGRRVIDDASVCGQDRRSAQSRRP
jgi:hypothetical protein